MGERGAGEGKEKGELGEKDLSTGWNVNFHERGDLGLLGLGLLSAEVVGLGRGNVPEQRTSNWRRHTSIPRRRPWAPCSERGSFQAVVSVWVDVGGGGGEGLDQEVAVMEGHVEAIPPHVFFPHERLPKLGTERENGLAG